MNPIRDKFSQQAETHNSGTEQWKSPVITIVSQQKMCILRHCYTRSFMEVKSSF